MKKDRKKMNENKRKERKERSKIEKDNQRVTKIDGARQIIRENCELGRGLDKQKENKERKEMKKVKDKERKRYK